MQNLKIALCGMGSAGRARLSALQKAEGIALAGTISRREGQGSMSFEKALKDPTIDAVAVSTENTSHASIIRRVLEAGKHALCDYPLSLSSKEAADLLRLAEKRQRILHIEHLGLLTEAHCEAVEAIERLGPLKSGEYRFEGNWNEKIGDAAKTGPQQFLAYSRLMQTAQWFGRFRLVSGQVTIVNEGFRLSLELSFDAGGRLRFLERREPTLPRRRWMEATFENGSYSWKPEPEAPGLFLRDLEFFRDRIRDRRPPYYDESLMLEVLKTLESLPSSR